MRKCCQRVKKQSQVTIKCKNQKFQGTERLRKTVLRSLQDIGY